MELSQKEYIEKINAKLKKLKGREGKIAASWIANITERYRNGVWRRNTELVDLLLDGNPENAEALFRGGLYLIFEKITGAAIADKALKMASRLHLYAYSSSVFRRSFRTKQTAAHVESIISMMEMLYFCWDDFDLIAFLKEQDTDEAQKMPTGVLVNLLALEIDEGNSEIIEAVKESCLGDNNTVLLDYTIITAVFKSENTVLLTLMRDLLLAAKLQEGLRQAILECADIGRVEAFILILKTIIDNGLLRYSSVLRAVDVWMGLGETADDSRRRVSEKVLNLAYLYLTDEAARNAAAVSRDVLELYVSLWARSVYEIAGMESAIDAMMRGEEYQKQTALYFLQQVNFNQLQSRIALKYIDEPDLAVFAQVLSNINMDIVPYHRDLFFDSVKIDFLADADLRNRLFARLVEVLPHIPQKGCVAGSPFEWSVTVLTRENVFRRLLCIAGYENDGGRNAALIENMPFSTPDNRVIFLNFLLEKPRDGAERDFVFALLEDKSMAVRAQALKNVKDLTLREDEDEKIIKLLALKTGDIRQNAVQILLALPDGRQLSAVNILLSDIDENKRLAGLDILLHLVKENRLTRTEALKYTAMAPKTSEREKILLSELSAEKADYTEENGFGLYDPDYMKKLKLKLPSSKQKMADIFSFSLPRMKQLLDSLCALIEENRDYAFTGEDYPGHTEDYVLGTMTWIHFPKAIARTTDAKMPTIDDFVLPEVWRGWSSDSKVTLSELLLFMFTAQMRYYRLNNRQYYTSRTNTLLKKWFAVDYVTALLSYYTNREYAALAVNIMELLCREFAEEERHNLLSGAILDLMKNIPEADWKRGIGKDRREYTEEPDLLVDTEEIDFLQTELKVVCQADERFSGYAAVCYELGRLSGRTYCGLNEKDVARAYEAGLVPRDALLKMFMNPSNPGYIRDYAGKPHYPTTKQTVMEHPVLLEAANEAAARIIEIERGRGDTQTAVSGLAAEITYHDGAQNFAAVLRAMGDETFRRGYFYHGVSITKKDALSHLLRISHPATGDSAETLRNALDGKIGDIRLLEAAMYAPAWLPVVAEYLGWKGLESAAWYFHAHIYEGFTEEKEAEVARYSPITPQDFNCGAFDVNWFYEAYQTIGKQRFEILYDCAKYLTDGANHRRAQIFADAALGKLNLPELQEEIRSKRNKDKLMAYSLIPLRRDRDKDLLARYEFIQKFLKESRQFGAMRRQSEGDACAIALDNLARTAGIADSLRLSWRMETLKIELISGYFTPRDCGGVQVSVRINEQGVAALVCESEGKTLASVPAGIKKDKYITECREVVSSLKEQQKRARKALENAMIRRDEFTYAELGELMRHPVISPLLQKLLFVCENRVGAFCELADLDGAAQLRIAHPYDLYKNGQWLNMQRFAFEHKLIQPFKQIFRELYLPNEDELREGDVSRRYAGHQVQVRKTAALLKSCGWTANYGEGMKKVYYKENVIAQMYAAADWFSPADVEEPTLETVCFFDRKTYRVLQIFTVPPVVFSEVMRDIDLVVSVAHVGGVDPEASLSTIELRSAIVRELLLLLRIDNVSVTDRHALIRGTLGEYTVHLGSGIVHKQGRGAINILAVPSQHRGRVFLPFADDDPRTAEIMSKILLLADDKSIKDPAILRQIR